MKMALTNFPNGISSFGIPVYGTSAGNNQLLTGNVWFVDTVAGSDGNDGTSPARAFQSLPRAITAAVANNNDYIFVLEGSTITVADATTIALSKAGLSIIGLGYGDARPVFNFTTANTATIAVSANNIYINNFRHTANFLSIAAAYTLTTATNLILDGNLFKDTSAILNFLNIVKSTGAANTVDGLTAINNIWTSLGTTSVNSFVLSANDIDRAALANNTVTMATTVDAAILLTVTAGVLTNLNCGWNKGYRNNTTTANGSLINVGGSTSSGFVYNNYVQTLTTTADKLFTTTVGLSAFNNLVTGVKGASGFLIPAADS
jgi:hypothetical protein